ncbi:MAG: low molecular weight phosphotyrosine protein phosphatase [Henriciella sp.]|nr:low molecular weight phosphotyrosine protein phosphatase [Henriciella sp.]
MKRLLFVCLGNICRSPAADGLARHMVAEAGLDWQIDSAGTGAWHVGSPPDPRMIQAASTRGLDLRPLRARQVEADDFHRFDHIYAMDRSNHADLTDIQPQDGLAQLHLFLENADVPDPYYGGEDGFDHVLDLIQARLKTVFDTLISN